MKKAIAIARVSSDQQASEDKVSHDEQLRSIREWAEREGYQIVDEYRETLSGATELDPDRKELRPLFWQAWDALRAGQVDAIIFWEPTRFCRDKQYSGLRAASYVLESRQHGDGIRFTIDEPNRDSPSGVLVLFVQSWGAAEELRGMVRRFHTGQQGALRQGHKGRGRNPFGYCWNTETKIFDEVEQEADLIRSIFQRYIGGEAVKAIAISLTESGVLSPDGQRKHKAGAARWQHSTVHRILTRSYYASGQMTGTFAGEDYSLPVPKIVDADLFKRVEERLESAQHFPRRLATRGLFQGLIRCASCGRGYHRGNYGGKQSATYFCPGRLTETQRMEGTAKCLGPYLNLPKTDAALWRGLLVALRDPKALAEGFLAGVDSDLVALRAQLGDQTGLEALREKRSWAFGQLANPGPSLEAIQGTITELDKQIARAESRLRGKEAEVARLQMLQAQQATLAHIIGNGQAAIMKVTAHGSDGLPLDPEADLTDWLTSGRSVIVLLANPVETPTGFAPIDKSPTARSLRRYHVTTGDRLLDYLGIKATVSPDRQLELVGNAIYWQTDSPRARSPGRTSRLLRGC